MDPFIGTIQLFAFDFVPRGWAACDGQLLPISQNTALFSLLGTQYGGDGRTTFALPDLRGRVPLGQGQGPGLSSYRLGQASGVEDVTLTQAQMPSHGHAVDTAAAPTSKSPVGNLPAVATGGSGYGPDASGTPMADGMIERAGGDRPHPNMQPYLVANWCIAVVGIFPSRD